MAIRPESHIFCSHLPFELSLCLREDRENDFGLREHFLTDSKAPEDKKKPRFSLKSMYMVVADWETRTEQPMADGRYELAPLLDCDKLEYLKRGFPMVRNTNLKPAEEHTIPFIDFEGCLPDEVPLEKCTLFEFKGEHQQRVVCSS